MIFEFVHGKGGDFLAISKAQQKATAKYNAKSYDRIELRVKKGEKAELQRVAAVLGYSLNEFINMAIEEKMDCCAAAVDKLNK